MIAFIDDHRDAYGVEPICRVLPIASSTYHAYDARRVDPSRAPARRPWSRSACRTQPRSVSAVQPIFAAIEPIAVHCEACSP